MFIRLCGDPDQRNVLLYCPIPLPYSLISTVVRGSTPPSLMTCCCRLLLDPPEILIDGKWFNYGVIFVVMCVDANMIKNQVHPVDLGG